MNHFLEFQKDEANKLWVMIHSGSRNIGLKIAKHYNEEAIKLCSRWKVDLPNKDLAFLPIGETITSKYLSDMKFALDFAYHNRHKMMETVFEIMDNIIQYKTKRLINIHHNYASWENHFGKNVIVHRKGATLARTGMLGIIPGSMGTPSYVVEGLGNKDSFESCSHGAGRVMSRSKASDTLTEEEVRKSMKGIIFGRFNKDRKGRTDLGEAPQAYKNIEDVMHQQSDLVVPLVKLTPLAVMKG